MSGTGSRTRRMMRGILRNESTHVCNTDLVCVPAYTFRSYTGSEELAACVMMYRSSLNSVDTLIMIGSTSLRRSTVRESCMLHLRCILQAGCSGSFHGLDHVLQAPRGQVDPTISGAEKPCPQKAFGMSFFLLCNCSACTVVLAQVDVWQSPTSEKRRPQWSGHG
jgi:hypothetical protein